MAKYLFRLDDITPGMGSEKFNRCMKIFSSYHVQPLLGVVPNNMDNKLNLSSPNPDFWSNIRDLVSVGKVMIAQHGYQHVYRTNERGILGACFGFSNGSEFAGLPYKEQLEMIRNGKKILKDEGLETDIFMAPNHSLDNNTIKALRVCGFTTITDGIALYSYTKKNICWIPQIFWRPRKFPLGIITFCLHTNSMNEKDFLYLEHFLSQINTASFYDIKRISYNGFHSIMNLLFQCGYVILRFLIRIIKRCKGEKTTK